MSRVMKVRCSAPARHINAIDLQAILERRMAFRFIGKTPAEKPEALPERLVLSCSECGAPVVLTRDMMLDFMQRTASPDDRHSD